MCRITKAVSSYLGKRQFSWYLPAACWFWYKGLVDVAIVECLVGPVQNCIYHHIPTYCTRVNLKMWKEMHFEMWKVKLKIEFDWFRRRKQLLQEPTEPVSRQDFPAWTSQIPMPWVHPIKRCLYRKPTRTHIRPLLRALGQRIAMNFPTGKAKLLINLHGKLGTRFTMPGWWLQWHKRRSGA